MNSLQFASRDKLRNYQETELKNLLEYLTVNSVFYRDHFHKHGIDINGINIDNLEQIPVVTKDDLQSRNMDFLCVDRTDIAEYCTTSGTLGKPVIVALTDNDLVRLTANEHASFTNAGITKADTILLMLSLDRQFMAGIAYYLGARSVGAAVIRGGPGNFAMQLEVIQRMQPTVLVAVPSFIAGMVAYVRDKKISLETTSVKKIVCIGENIRDENLEINPLGKRITDHWIVQLYSTYASTEQQTAFTECEIGCGGHHNPGLLYFEILDSAGNRLPSGEYGELVITTFGVTGMPLLRYNTGDICTYFDKPCKCGRTSARLSPIAGRKQQMIKLRGTTLYPQAVFNLLNGLDPVQDYAVSLTKNDLGTDELRIHLALKPGTSLAETEIRHAFQSALRVVPEFHFTGLTEIQQLQQSEGKRKLSRLIDHR